MKVHPERIFKLWLSIHFLALLFGMIGLPAHLAAREIQPLVSGWRFQSGEVTGAERVGLNDNTLDLKNKGQYEYRLRRNDVIYEPGELKVIA
jgi:hypothetical protein